MKLILQELFILYVKNTLEAKQKTKLNSNLYKFEKFLSKKFNKKFNKKYVKIFKLVC